MKKIIVIFISLAVLALAAWRLVRTPAPKAINFDTAATAPNPGAATSSYAAALKTYVDDQLRERLRVEAGALRLTRFDGINAYLLKVKLTADGKLEGLINSERKVIAERADKAQAASLPPLPDPNNYTRMKNPAEPFRFSFPDLDGKPVSSTDERFRNKVVIITIGGSWCPNCHEEAAVLRDFYDRYQGQGLEIVGLMFEYTGEADRDREQMRIFARRHNLRYPLLLAGATEEGEVEKKLPQLENFSAYPTAIFIGRDGRVKRIHAGFEGQATGARHTQLKAELDEFVRELLGSDRAGS